MRSSLFVRLVSLGLFAVTLSSVPAAAQGFFDNIFRDDRYQGRQGGYTPRGGNSYAPAQQQNSWGWGWGQRDQQPAPQQQSSNTGRAVAYCVRLCDGHFFPMPRNANATSVQLCNDFCPAAKTQVFNGSEIGHAVAANGAAYSSLENAFVYRQKIVDNCTCNGKDAFGLAKIDIANDPTLKPGDIVSTGDNVKVALTAMMAAKERREAAAEAVEKRNAGRKLASQPAPVVPGDSAATEPEERPED